MSIKAIGFDLDDTLYDRYFIYESVFNEMEEKHISLNIPFENFNEILQEYSLQEFDLFAEGKKEKYEYKVDRVISTYKYFGIELSIDLASFFNERYEYYRDKIVPRKNVKRVLNLLCTTDIEIFVLTNGPEYDQKEKIKNLGLEVFFDESNIFISDAIGIAKPDIRLFEFVEKSLSVKGKEILYIGDNLSNDILASNKSNWNSLFFNFENAETSLIDSLSNVTVVSDFYGVEKILLEEGII